MEDKSEKAKKLAIVALVFALLAIGINGSVTTTGNNTTINCADCDLKINKTGDNITNGVFTSASGIYSTILNFNGGLFEVATSNANSGISTYIGLDASQARIGASNGESNSIDITPNNTVFSINGESIALTSTSLNMGGLNITNCGNCNASSNLKVNKTGDTMTGMLNATGGLTAPNFTIGAAIPITFGVVAGTMARAGDIVISRSSTDRLLIGSGTFGSSSYVVVGAENLFYPVQKPTSSAPTYHLGAMYFDTTLNKLRIGGATGWETVTSI